MNKDPVALLVCQASQATADLQDLQESQVSVENQAREADKDHKEIEDPLDQRVNQASTDRAALLDLQVLTADQATRDQWVNQDHLVTQARQDHQGLLDPEDLQDHRETEDPTEKVDHLDLLVCPASEDLKDRTAHLATQGPEDQMDNQVTYGKLCHPFKKH